MILKPRSWKFVSLKHIQEQLLTLSNYIFTLEFRVKQRSVVNFHLCLATSEVVETVTGQKHHISTHTLARSVHPTAPVLFTKD